VCGFKTNDFSHRGRLSSKKLRMGCIEAQTCLLKPAYLPVHRGARAAIRLQAQLKPSSLRTVGRWRRAETRVTFARSQVQPPLSFAAVPTHGTGDQDAGDRR
jgi:hypothetical protein